MKKKEIDSLFFYTARETNLCSRRKKKRKLSIQQQDTRVKGRARVEDNYLFIATAAVIDLFDTRIARWEINLTHAQDTGACTHK